jgi:hypothetical protein
LASSLGGQFAVSATALCINFRRKQGSAKLPETLDVSTIVDSIGVPANQWNWPLKAVGWA